MSPRAATASSFSTATCSCLYREMLFLHSTSFYTSQPFCVQVGPGNVLSTLTSKCVWVLVGFLRCCQFCYLLIGQQQIARQAHSPPNIVLHMAFKFCHRLNSIFSYASLSFFGGFLQKDMHPRCKHRATSRISSSACGIQRRFTLSELVLCGA